MAGEACTEHDDDASMLKLYETLCAGHLKQLDHVCSSGMLRQLVPSERQVLQSAASTSSVHQTFLDYCKSKQAAHKRY